MKIIQLEAAHANIDMIELRQRERQRETERERGEREELRADYCGDYNAWPSVPLAGHQTVYPPEQHRTATHRGVLTPRFRYLLH